jgi:hypothetical protein
MKTGDGPGHYIVCADFDSKWRWPSRDKGQGAILTTLTGDGDDEILVSLFGPLDRDEGGAVDYEVGALSCFVIQRG